MSKRKSKRRITKGERKWIITQMMLTVAGVLLVWGVSSLLEQYLGSDIMTNPLLVVIAGIAIFIFIAWYYEKKYVPFK